MGSTALAMRYSLNAGALDDRTRHGYHERDAEGEGRNPHEPVRDKRRRDGTKARSGEQEKLRNAEVEGSIPFRSTGRIGSLYVAHSVQLPSSAGFAINRSL